MKVHEYQARALLAGAGIPVPPGAVIEAVAQAAPTYKRVAREAELGDNGLVVVKAQVHAGGRGKAGKVMPVKAGRVPDELRARLDPLRDGIAGSTPRARET